MTARILAVDDDAVNRKVVSIALSRAGYEVFTTQDGPETLEQVDGIQPNLIILDVMMPGMDGYEVCRRLRLKPGFAHLPIMMLTANDTLEQKIKGFEVGADDYMVKPFQPAELAARVQALLRRARVTPTYQAAQAESKVIALFSLRGGVGVSTLATNLALGLAQLWELPTVLADLALAGGQSALMLNLSLRNSLVNLVHIPLEEFDANLVDQVLLSHPSGLRVLAAPPSPEHGEMIKAEYVARVLQILMERNHYLILDLPHDFRETTVAGLDLAHKIVVMMAPEMASVYMVKRTFETFDKLGYDRSKVFLVLNWTFERQGLARKDIENALGQRVNLVIPYAPDPLVEALNTGIPPIIKSPDSPIGALFEDLAFYLSKEEHQAEQPAEPTVAWKRVFQRRQKRKRKHK